jgi:hypothetical protein
VIFCGYFIFRIDTFRPRFTLLREKTFLQSFIYPGSEKAIMSFIRKISCYSILILSIFSAVPTFAAAEDRVTVDRDVVFRRGAISASLRGRITRGTTHLYRVRARAGQEMAIVLRTGEQTSATVFAPTEGIVEGADGIRQTLVELPETGEYLIQIGTDAAANYTLEITIN